MIVSKLLEIERVEALSTEYIEQELKKRSVEPIRWAIVEVREKTLVLSLACFE